VEKNFAILKECIAEFEKDMRNEIKVKLIEIEHKLGETQSEHISLFKELISTVPKACEIYTDITYGTKPTPLAVFAALSYINLLRPESSVEQIVYGQADFAAGWDTDKTTGKEYMKKANIYDVTKLFNIISIVEHMNAAGGENIEKAIELILRALG
jgi:hypothetical protein